MKALSVTSLVLMAAVVACGKQQKVKARIFERKQVEQNRIMIRYEYNFNNSTYTDSNIIRNTVIKGDSISVIIDPSKPGKSLPDLSE